MLSAATDAVPIKTLLFTVFQSITEVFLLCVAGYTLAYAGVTDKATQRKLNIINVSLFTPALLFSKVAFSLTPAKLMEMWIIPLSFVVITGVSAAVAWFLSKVFNLSRGQRAFAICAAMFQNSNSLPIALVQSLAPDIPGLKWGDDDTKDQMLGRALAYLVVYSTLGMILRWSYGVQLLASADEEEHGKISDDSADVFSLHGNGNGNSNGNGHAHGHAHAQDHAHGHAHAQDHAHGHAHAHGHEDAHAHGHEHAYTHAHESVTGAAVLESPVQLAHVLSPAPLHSGSNPFDDPPARRRPASIVSEHPGMAGYTTPPNVRSPSPSLPISASVSARALYEAGVTHGRRPIIRRASTSSRRAHTPSRADSGRDFLGLPDAPHHSRLMDLTEDSSESEAETEDEWGAELPLLRRRRSPPREGLRAAWYNVKIKIISAWRAFYDFMTVPTWAALLSIIIALIPPLQARIADVKPFVAAVKSAGQCSVPVTLVVLGAFFYSPPPAIELQPDEDDDQPLSIKGYFERKIRALKQGGEQQSLYPGEGRTVFVACVSRMIIVPLIFLPVIAMIARYDFFAVAEDPIFILCVVLLVSSPTALTLAQITQAASGDAFERLISKTISIQYAILTPPLTIVYVVVGLFFTKL